MVVWVSGCAVAAWWQVGRAAQGNQFSYLYAVEWPVFAVAGAFCWWALLHTDASDPDVKVQRRALAERARAQAHVAMRNRDEEDEELAAYNDHLAALAAEGRRKGWRS